MGIVSRNRPITIGKNFFSPWGSAWTWWFSVSAVAFRVGTTEGERRIGRRYPLEEVQER